MNKMMDEQYDISEEMKRIYFEKQKQRRAAREYYQKLLYNPHRPITQPILDPALLRFSAYSSYRVEYFKPTASTFAKYFLSLCPLFLFYWHLRYSRHKYEESIRSGLVSYKERMNRMF